jgi:hypothetical protein
MGKLRPLLLVAVVMAVGSLWVPLAESASAASPAVTTEPATLLAQSSMTLNGVVDPKGLATTYHFEYGTTTQYGYQTALVDAGAGTSNVKAAAQLTGLVANTTYHFRLVAVSAGGTTLGADRSATTLPSPPAVVTGVASKVGASSAVLNAVIDPEGQSTHYYFQFGITTSYGVQTPLDSVGSEATNIALGREVEGLSSNTIYHYRVVAQNKGGTSYGADRTLKTGGQASVPSTLRILGRMLFVSRGGWVGVAMGCFAGQTRCAGRVSLTYGATLIGGRRFGIAAANGGSQVLRLNRTGRRMFGRHYHGPVPVEVTVVTTGGQQISRALTAARWF